MISSSFILICYDMVSSNLNLLKHAIKTILRNGLEELLYFTFIRLKSKLN